jgi:RNA polymerase sigma-70 factor (ECF subfamily)
MPAVDERNLVLLAKEGNRAAFRSLVELHMRKAYDIAFGVVNNHADAEDIVQETFVRVHRSIGSFRGDSQFGTWLYRIVMNLALNRATAVRSRARFEVPIAHEAVLHQAQAKTMPVEDDLQSHIERAVHELPTLQRAVVILRHLNGLSTRQVSGILKCSEGTVKTHLHRGMKKMKTLLAYLEENKK